ncbi:MAG: site-specific integrase [Dehalococcoidia bacterium]|nr:site-specific integrase [Dehalococcoidia bacterium]
MAALITGCRLGELLSLQWKQIRINDKGQQEIVLPASKTKTHKNREIPVSSDLRAVLEMRRTDPKGNPFGPEAFVFGNEAGEPIKRVITAWRNTCRRAGISELHFHDLRREFACGLLEGRRGRADLSVVREFLGHANITTTSRYLKTTTTRMREALEQREVSPEPPSDAAESPHASEVR